MDAVTSLNGSGPAFAYIVLEALCDGGVRMGLRRDTAMQIAAQMLQGAARMVLQTGLHPAALKDQVTTPAGSTIAGLLILEDGRIRSVIARAVEEAATGRQQARTELTSRRARLRRPVLGRRPGQPGQPDGHGDRPRHRQRPAGRDPLAEGEARASEARAAAGHRAGAGAAHRAAVRADLADGADQAAVHGAGQRDVGAGSGAAGGRPLPHLQGDARAVRADRALARARTRAAPTASRRARWRPCSRSSPSTSCSRSTR